MSACEKCWADAFTQSQMTGEGQPEAYKRLLNERREDPCSIEEQRGLEQ